MSTEGSRLAVHALRLGPGTDLKKELAAFAKARDLEAAAVLSVVGSLSFLRLRFAGKSEPMELAGNYEIVALGGTIARGGSAHLHLAASDAEGRMIGGHLLEGCRVRTTAEIVLGEALDLAFTRAPDAITGYMELVIRARCGV